MEEKTHQKHTRLTRPALGQWGRNEWAILGAVCSEIQALAREISARLSNRWRMGFVDAEHGALPLEGTQTTLLTDSQGNWLSPLPVGTANNPWERRTALIDLDLILVNGNHFEADRQILALDRRKFDSLSRKLHRLTRVDLLLTRSGDRNFVAVTEMPEFLQEHLTDWKTIPVLDLSDPDAIAGFLEKRLRIPNVKALILAGGKSTRMGEDKAGLFYHGQPQWQHLRDMLERQGLETFISCRPEQATQFGDAAIVPDTFADLGPMGALLSAFRYDPDAAWLALACDLPLLDAATIRFLLQYRNPAATATAYRQAPDEPDKSTQQDFPEPLVAIWEPKSYASLLRFLAQGVSCPRKVLINSNTHLLDVPAPRALLNANTREERAIVLEKYLGKE